MPAAIWGGMNKSQPVVLQRHAADSSSFVQQHQQCRRTSSTVALIMCPSYTCRGRLMLCMRSIASSLCATTRAAGGGGHQGSATCKAGQLPTAANLQDGRARALQPNQQALSVPCCWAALSAEQKQPTAALPTNTNSMSSSCSRPAASSQARRRCWQAAAAAAHCALRLGGLPRAGC